VVPFDSRGMERGGEGREEVAMDTAKFGRKLTSMDGRTTNNTDAAADLS